MLNRIITSLNLLIIIKKFSNHKYKNKRLNNNNKKSLKESMEELTKDQLLLKLKNKKPKQLMNH